MQMTVNQKPEGRTWTFELSEREMVRYLADAIILVASDAKTAPKLAMRAMMNAPDGVLENLANKNHVAKIFCAYLIENRRLGVSTSEKDADEAIQELERIARRRVGGQ